MCSDALPLCVHGTSEHSDIARTLRALEQVASTLTGRGWARPNNDMGMGGSSAFDVYLSDAPWSCEPWSHSFGLAYPDAPFPAVGARGRSAWASVHDHLGSDNLRLTTLARVYARSVLYGMDSTYDDTLAESTSAYMAYALEPCSVAYLGAAQDLQTRPELGIISRDIDDPTGSFLFPWFLEQNRSSSSPFDLLRALWTLAEDHATMPSFNPNKTSNSFLHVVRATNPQKSVSPGDAWLQFAITRAFMGKSADETMAPWAAGLGEEGSVRVDWDLPFSSLPRRVLASYPVRPTGSAYVRVELTHAKKGEQLILHAQWESNTVFRIALLLFDAQGHLKQTRLPPTIVREPHLSTLVDDVSSFSSVLIVAANVGDAKNPGWPAPARVAASPGSGLSLALYRR